MITEKLKNVTHIPENYLTETPPPPKSVKIELTSNCNYKCKFCSISDRDFKPANMKWDLFKKIVNEINNLKIQEIGLFLIGEPFSNFPLLLDAITYLKKDLNFPYVFITSNGSLASKHKVEQCMKAGLDSLKWSCNSSNIEQFEKLTGVNKLLFEMTKKNIKEAYDIRKSGNYNIKLYASSIYYNSEQKNVMNEFLNKYVKPYVDEHYWLPLYTMGGGAINREIELGYKPIPGNSGTLDDPVDPIPCWTLFTEGHILSDGRMSACCADSTGNWTVGDLNKMSFMDAWNSKDFKDLRRLHLNKNIIGSKCEHCALLSK